MTLIDRIRALESTARRLEPGRPQRESLAGAVQRYADDFLDGIAETPAFVSDHDHGRALYEAPITDDPMAIDDLLALVRRAVDRPNLNPASGGHLGYVPGGGIYPAALGDYLACVTNKFAGIYFASPGAVRMEHLLIRWMADLIGYPPAAGGDLTSGGSVANLAAVVTAREALGLAARDFERSVVYLTPHAHHCLGKALKIAGMADCRVRHVDVDGHHRMRPDALETAIRADQQGGWLPWLVIASAGTTDTGSVDPLAEVAAVARHFGAWYHIDAAYGGFFLLCPEGRTMLRGIDRGDSVVIDPHKGLFLPYGTGAVLVRERRFLQAAHAYQADYMQDADEAEDEYSPADHSPELTRHFRGMRLWLALKVLGLEPFRASLEEKLLLARYFHTALQEIDGFEVGPFPDLSIVTYRFVPKRGDADEFNRRLVREVQRDGRVFISSTMLDGRFTLRLAVLNFRTHLDTIEYALDVLQRKARELEGETR